jgi:hypothetical protein
LDCRARKSGVHVVPAQFFVAVQGFDFISSFDATGRIAVAPAADLELLCRPIFQGFQDSAEVFRPQATKDQLQASHAVQNVVVFEGTELDSFLKCSPGAVGRYVMFPVWLSCHSRNHAKTQARSGAFP